MADARRIAAAAWAKLEDRIRLAEPRILERFPAGASPSALDKVERQLGAKLPPLVREIYRIHDGVGMPAFVKKGRYREERHSYFLCLADALDQWRVWCEGLSGGFFKDFKVENAFGPVRADWWNPLWLPITTDGGGNNDCVDLDPAPRGRVGQVIQVWHDDHQREVLAPDLATYLLDRVEEDEWAAAFRAEQAAKAEPRRHARRHL